MNTEHFKAVLGYHLNEQLEFPFMAKLKLQYKIRRIIDNLEPWQFEAALHKALAWSLEEKHHE